MRKIAALLENIRPVPLSWGAEASSHRDALSPTAAARIPRDHQQFLHISLQRCCSLSCGDKLCPGAMATARPPARLETNHCICKHRSAHGATASSTLSFLPPSLDISAQEGQEVKKNFREPLKRQTTMKPAQPAITSVQVFSPDEARRCLSHPSRRQPAALALLLSRARGELMQQRDLCPVTHSSRCMQLCDPAAPSVLCRS